MSVYAASKTNTSRINRAPSLLFEGKEVPGIDLPHHDGMVRRVYVERSLTRDPNPHRKTMGMLVHTSEPEGEKLLGLRVEPEFRGRGLGEAMLETYLADLEDKERLFVGTNSIHKPTIAYLLRKAGMWPKHAFIAAELLPPQPNDNSDMPRVIRHGDQRLIDRLTPESTRFYEAVPKHHLSDDERFPLQIRPQKTVAIHTSYLPH